MIASLIICLLLEASIATSPPSPRAAAFPITLANLQPPVSQTLQNLMSNAVYSGNVNEVEFLLEYVDLSEEKEYILRTASARGHEKIVALLLGTGKVSVTANNYECFRAACKNGHLSVAKLLYETGNIPSARIQNDYAIRKAAKHGRTEVVQWLLSLGADPTGKSNEAVRMAASNGHLGTVQVLCSCVGVRPDIKLSEAALGAAYNGHTDVLEYLLGFDGVTLGYYGVEVLSMAVGDDFPNVLRVLLKDGRLDPTFWNNYLLLQASSQGRSRCLEMLLEDKRVQIAAAGQHDFPPLNYACFNGHLECVEVLLNMHPACDPGHRESKAVRLAARRNHIPVVRRLLQDERIQSSPKFNRVIRKAESRGWYELRDLLLEDERTSESWRAQSNSAVRRISRSMKNFSPRNKPKIVYEHAEGAVEKKGKYSAPPDRNFIRLLDSEQSRSSASHGGVSLESQ